MLVYATDTDLGAWSTNLPANTAPYLRAASALVATATTRDIYDVDPAGKPTDPTVIDAMRDATCMQVAFWLANDIDPTAGALGFDPIPASSSIAGGSVSVDTAAQNAAALASLSGLIDTALAELRRAGLATSRVRT